MERKEKGALREEMVIFFFKNIVEQDKCIPKEDPFRKDRLNREILCIVYWP